MWLGNADDINCLACDLAAKVFRCNDKERSLLRRMFWNVRFAPILLQKSAYRRRGTAGAFFDATCPAVLGASYTKKRTVMVRFFLRLSLSANGRSGDDRGRHSSGEFLPSS